MHALHHWIFRLGVAGLTLLFASAAHASSYAECGIYVARASAVPSPVWTIMSTRRDAVAHACLDFNGVVGLYAPVSPVRASAAHVCRFDVLPIVYPVRVVRDPIPHLMLEPPNGCPRQDASAYVEAFGVSDQAFVALSALVDRLCAPGRKDFRDAVSPAAPEVAAVSGQLAALCTMPPISRPQLRSWLLGIWPDNSVVSHSKPGKPTLRLSFADFGIEGQFWNVWCDDAPDGMTVLKVEHTADMMD